MSELTPRERSLQIAKWLFHMQDLAKDIDRDSIIPVTTKMEYQQIEITMAGVAYEHSGYETFYLVGAGPYERVLAMAGKTEHEDVCFTFARKHFYVSAYLPKHAYDSMDHDVRDKFYPFGANLTLRESVDLWLCQDRATVRMKPDFDLTVTL